MSERVVVFDLGRVVIDWDPLPAIAAGVGEHEATAFLEADDVSFAHWNLEQDRGRTWAEAVRWLEREHPAWARHGAAYAEHYGASLTGRVPGTRAIIERLRDRGVRIAALTNWSAETIHLAPERFDEVAWFEDVIVSGEEGVAKPDPRIFAIVEQRLGVPSESVVFTDDSAANVAAAQEHGWDAVLFASADRLEHDLRERGLLD